MRTEVTMEKAVGIAEELDDVDFTEAVASAVDAGLDTVELITDDDGNVFVVRPKGVMIAWKPPQWLREKIAVPGGTECDEIHLTLLSLGDVEDWTPDQQRTIIGVTTEIAGKTKEIRGGFRGVGRFRNGEDEDPVVLIGDFPGLNELRERLVAALGEAGIEFEDKFDSFIPHVTIGWMDAEVDAPLIGIQELTTVISNVTVYIAGTHYEIDLDGLPWDDYGYPVEPQNLYVPLLKASEAQGTQTIDDEQRYSYGPWYVPDSVDAHNEWATATDVQKSLWGYVQGGDRQIRLQHNVDVVAGEWVELATFPFAVDAPVQGPDGVMVKHRYPAGTPFMGVIWTEEAWPLVKSGAISGFSVGGTAQRMEVAFEADELAKSALK